MLPCSNEIKRRERRLLLLPLLFLPRRIPIAQAKGERSSSKRSTRGAS
jgi:hypothetical protein